MITIKFPHNGLPDELRNIPSGQIILLTNPEKGIVAKNVRVLEFIYSMAKQYNQQYIINAIPVNYSGLWDAFICKVDTDKGPQVLAADSSSIIEMLCEFWELDYEAVCKDIDIKPRYPKITCGREDHPIRVDVPATKKSSYTEPDFDGGPSLHCMTYTEAPDITTIKKNILSSLVESETDISIEELHEILKEAQKQRELGYNLELKIENKGNKRDPDIIVTFWVKDNKGNKYPFKLETAMTAVYLTFLYSKEELYLVDFCDVNDENHKIFQTIYASLHNKKGSVKTLSYDSTPIGASPERTPEQTKELIDKQDNDRNNATSNLVQIISRIRSKIADSLPNDRTARQFIISSKADNTQYSIFGTNQEIRNKIKNGFYLT